MALRGKSTIRKVAAIAGLALLVGGGHVLYRAARVWRVAVDFRDQIRYLVENQQTIGQQPAADTLNMDYLTKVFGDNPELLSQLRSIVQRGLADDPTLALGEVAALVVTYHRTEDGQVANVVVHAIGGFPLTRKKPGFHRQGYFFQQIDNNLWTFGNVAISFLGRDVVFFSSDEVSAERQRELIDSIFSGEIGALVQELEPPLYFSVVFPEPRDAVPLQLRNHVQAIVMKGYLSHQGGNTELMVLTPSVRSATYTLSLLNDMKTASQVALRTKWGGVPKKNAWGIDEVDWWAYEMVKTLEEATLEKEYGLVRMRSHYERVMVNAILKSIERMSRDLAAMRAIEDDRLDPRLADARLLTKHPLHYWSEEHQWGPNWPIPMPQTNPPTLTPVEVPADSSPQP